MQIRTVICIGFGKSGTTSLYKAFAQTPKSMVSSGRKELNFFKGDDRNIDAYLSEFGIRAIADDLAGKVLFEASPSYATGPKPSVVKEYLQRIKGLFPDAVIVVCMRHPVKRAYSHYLHNLQRFAVFGDGCQRLRPGSQERNIVSKMFAADFRTALFQYRSLTPSYSRTLDIALELFGSERVIPYFLEADSKDFGSFMSRISDAVGVELAEKWKGQAAPHARMSRSVPEYRYAEAPVEVDCSGGQIGLQTHVFLAVSGPHQFILRNVPVVIGRRLEFASGQWSRGVGARLANDVMKAFFELDIRKTMSIADRLGWNTGVLEGYLAPMAAYKTDLRERSAIRDWPVEAVAGIKVVDFAR